MVVEYVVGYAGDASSVAVFDDYRNGRTGPERGSRSSRSSDSETRSFNRSYSRIEAAEGHCPHVVGEVGDGSNERENAGKSLVQMVG